MAVTNGKYFEFVMICMLLLHTTCIKNLNGRILLLFKVKFNVPML